MKSRFQSLKIIIFFNLICCTLKQTDFFVFGGGGFLLIFWTCKFFTLRGPYKSFVYFKSGIQVVFITENIYSYDGYEPERDKHRSFVRKWFYVYGKLKFFFFKYYIEWFGLKVKYWNLKKMKNEKYWFFYCVTLYLVYYRCRITLQEITGLSSKNLMHNTDLTEFKWLVVSGHFNINIFRTQFQIL